MPEDLPDFGEVEVIVDAASDFGWLIRIHYLLQLLNLARLASAINYGQSVVNRIWLVEGLRSVLQNPHLHRVVQSELLPLAAHIEFEPDWFAVALYMHFINKL